MMKTVFGVLVVSVVVGLGLATAQVRTTMDGLPLVGNRRLSADECLRTFPPDRAGGFCEWYGHASSRQVDAFERARGFRRVKHTDGSGDTWESSAQDPQKEILALRAEVNALKEDIRILKNQSGPSALRVHVKWDPKDWKSLAQIKLALGSSFFNHGGLLRVSTRDEGFVELGAGEFLTFESPRWTPVATSRGK